MCAGESQQTSFSCRWSGRQLAKSRIRRHPPDLSQVLVCRP
ncbi:hypothetical protein LINGRAHAP2_LOCUS16740 [Linum grandiflorum]